MNSYPRSKKEWLKDNLDRMEANEHNQVFAIIKKYTDQFTKTQSGVLVSTDNLPSECLTEIEQYIHFCLDQKKRMEDDMKTRKSYERLVNHDQSSDVGTTVTLIKVFLKVGNISINSCMHGQTSKIIGTYFVKTCFIFGNKCGFEVL